MGRSSIMNTKKEIVFGIWNSHENYLGKRSAAPENHKVVDYLANIFCPGHFFYYIIDSPSLTFDFVSPSVKELLDLAPEQFTMQSFFELIHPDDLGFFMKCEDIVAYFLKSCILPEKMTKYKISYCFRLRTKTRGYRMFLIQTITIKTTADGALLKVFGSQTDISHITNINNYKLSLIGLDGEPSYMELDVMNHKVLDDYTPFQLNHPFSKRELQILRLLALGKNTPEIADELFISKHTVETHRKNILLKGETKNVVELIAKCIRNGVI